MKFNLTILLDAGTTYTYAQKLTGAANSQIGLAKSFKVYPGDKVKIEAYAKYYNPQSTTSNLTGFASALLAAFGQPVPVGGEVGTASVGLNNYGGIIGGGGGAGNSTYPKAFVNILIFDKNHNFLDIAFEQIDGGEQPVGNGTKLPHDYMSREYTVKEAGYAYMFVSNESPTLIEAYFDDLTFTYTPSNIVQYNEFYPFGLNTANSWTRENFTGNNFQYNESTELNPASGYYDLFFRNFDPALGRFMQVDPLASLYHNQSTYQYGNNDPVYWSDPSGAGGDEAKKAFDRADGDFDALNLLAAGGGMFGASYNMLTYGSSYGFGGATSIGGFGSNYHGYWEKYLSGGHYEITGARNPTSLDAGGEGESYWVSEYSRRFIELEEQNEDYPFYTHEYIIRKAFEDILSNQQINWLVQGSEEADSKRFQDSKYSYMHAMLGPKETQPEGEKALSKYLATHLKDFEYYGTDEGNFEELAFFSLGMGMHPLMDKYSPSHRGWQTWNDSFGSLVTKGIWHIVRESFTFEGVDAATAAIKNYYYQAIGNILLRGQ